MDLQELKKILLEIRKIHSIEAILHWDQETYMPSGSGSTRAEQIAYLSSMAHQIHTSDKFRSLLKKHVNMENGKALLKNVDQDTQRLLFLIWKEHKNACALPQDFVEKLSQHCSISQQVWAKARQDNRFETFKPYLEKMVQLKKQEAEYYGYDKYPYDSLLDKYEPGMTSDKVESLFSECEQSLVELVKRIRNSPVKINEEPLKQSFNTDKQWEFGKGISKAMGYDFNKGRLDKSTHPFTISFHPSDVRITTRLNENNFKSGIFSTIHETGHALYEQGLSEEHYGTPFGDAISLGIHESQSRLWENIIGRSKSFWKYYYPLLKRAFPQQLNKISLDQFYMMINTVSPSLIRVEADEVTYSLHIILRFDIERKLINENLPVKELPEVWNQKMKDYLGVVPSDDKDGVLQDVHWSAGLFGYFPTYALGNLYAELIMGQAKVDLPQLENQIEKGELLPLREWLKEKIHCKGQRWDAEELITHLTGQPLSSKPFLDYLWKKYGEIYQFE